MINADDLIERADHRIDDCVCRLDGELCAPCDLIIDLAAALREARGNKDAAYEERNRVVAALAKCFPSGTAKTAIEGWSEDWHGCVYIDLPTGQASWHYHDSQAWMFSQLPSYQGEWDGHTTDEKYRRIEDLTVKHLRDANQEAWNAIKALGESRQRLLGALAVLVSDGVISSSRARELGGMTISEQRAYLRAAIDAAMGGEG